MSHFWVPFGIRREDCNDENRAQQGDMTRPDLISILVRQKWTRPNPKVYPDGRRFVRYGWPVGWLPGKPTMSSYATR